MVRCVGCVDCRKIVPALRWGGQHAEEAMTDFDPVVDLMGGQSYATAGEDAMTDDVQKRINNRLKELAQKVCRGIGCSGLEPDLCNNHPQDCKTVRKIMGCREHEEVKA